MRGAFVLCAVLAVPSTASAGRSFYGWLYGTDVLPERGVELGTWIQQEEGQPSFINGQSNFPEDETRWWEAVEVGITDQLEIVFPVEIAWQEGTTIKNASQKLTTFDRIGIDLRYRLVTSDPVHAPAFVPLVRVAAFEDVTTPGATILEGDLVGSYTVGRVQALVDLGVAGEVGENTNTFEVHPGAGISIETVPDLRFGAEVFADIAVANEPSGYWLIAGPNVAWTHGRFWLSAAYGIGVHGIRDAPRAQWGIAF